MGLDMFAFKTKVKPAQEVDFEVDSEESEEIKYWRKHPNLHGWMENLYRHKNGKEEWFNCVNVQLNEEELHRLAACIIDENLPETEGFFFGQSYNNEEEKAEDLEFVKEALKAVEEGYTVYYTSWW